MNITKVGSLVGSFKVKKKQCQKAMYPTFQQN